MRVNFFPDRGCGYLRYDMNCVMLETVTLLFVLKYGIILPQTRRFLILILMFYLSSFFVY